MVLTNTTLRERGGMDGEREIYRVESDRERERERGEREVERERESGRREKTLILLSADTFKPDIVRDSRGVPRRRWKR